MDTRHDSTLHLVRMDRGERIMESLLKYVKEHEIRSGFLTGIGAARPVEIGWYDLNAEEYLTKVFDENFEITGLVGNIAWSEGAPIVHAHIMLGRQDYSVIGGHLIEGTIAVTGEFWIRTATFPVGRSPCEFKGLKLIDFNAT